MAILTKEPALIEVFQKGLDMHSRVTCQVHGLNYDMFEQIRNYKGESEQETKDKIKKAIENWAGTDELKYAIQYHATKEVSKLDPNVCDKETIETLASFFELLRKKMKSVVFGMPMLCRSKTSLISVKPVA